MSKEEEEEEEAATEGIAVLLLSPPPMWREKRWYYWPEKEILIGAKEIHSGRRPRWRLIAGVCYWPIVRMSTGQLTALCPTLASRRWRPLSGGGVLSRPPSTPSASPLSTSGLAADF
ncbi:hypothetical protein EYF80_016670 [Liparis tanakae]|uniref:Uncharacterized protein n=1 Tax=Liparis tanakae TaxID=230148 RepID=A0A4Z2I790_9TELE|nr:hypothetical protein EYF80_016670 [Liparis tanakae]